MEALRSGIVLCTLQAGGFEVVKVMVWFGTSVP